MKLQLKIKKVIDYLPKKDLSKVLPITEYQSVSQVLSEPKSDWLRKQYKDKNSAVSKACRQGTLTHKALETGTSKDDLTSKCLEVFERDILVDLDEVWGQEEWLAHPLGYKGKFDGVGVFRGKVTLFDHKKTNKRKTQSGLTSYFKQLSAYKQAHEYLYKKNKIEQIAIFNIFGKEIDGVGTNVTILSPEQVLHFTSEFNGRLG